MVTANTDHDDLAAYAANGAFDVVKKPWTWHDLSSSISKAIVKTSKDEEAGRRV